eukprot:6223037-Prymnesium_polylepis.2
MMITRCPIARFVYVLNACTYSPRAISKKAIAICNDDEAQSQVALLRQSHRTPPESVHSAVHRPPLVIPRGGRWTLGDT